jgi:hypothetical protein
VDVNLKLNSTFRTYPEAKDERDGGDPHQFGIGPRLQLYLKPPVRLEEVAKFDLDDTKSRFLVLESGYRYITAPGAPPENRVRRLIPPSGPVFTLQTATARTWTGKTAVSPGGIGTN